MEFLVDTNVISELRKGNRCDRGVAEWFRMVTPGSIWLSVLVLGEVKQGIERLRDRDPITASHLDLWLGGLLETYEDRTLSITPNVALRWAGFSHRRAVPLMDGLIAATALENKLSVATRNVVDFSKVGVNVVNPFEF